MTLDNFKNFIESFGAHPDHWPPGHAEAIQAFIDGNADLAEPILNAERSVDALWADYEMPETSDLLAARILRTLPEHGVSAPRAANTRRPFSKLLQWGSVAAALAIGAVLGFGGAQIASPNDVIPDNGEVTEILAYNNLGYSDLTELDELGFLDVYAWTQDVDLDTLDLSGVDSLISDDTL